MSTRYREEVLNVVMAECISARGITAVPETIILDKNKTRNMPDVITSFRGLRCVIEGKMEDAPRAREKVINDIKERVVNGIAHLAIGVVYPAFLRTVAFNDLSESLTRATLEFIVCSEAGDGEWQHGMLDSLLHELRWAYDTLVRDDVLVRSVERLQVGMQGLIDALYSHQATCYRLADILGVYKEESDGESSAIEG